MLTAAAPLKDNKARAAIVPIVLVRTQYTCLCAYVYSKFATVDVRYKKNEIISQVL